eukprot:TRINITY_DN6225_c0_g1_i3.p1 TRINITY_DN6225_c0_g1~~TRINITY_DN6225_c0_g1_i3.p1  ORF type:complete len:1520 (-),score=188.41 TRINITY_DN6225_c0_g1_i3:463-4995(-)
MGLKGTIPDLLFNFSNVTQMDLSFNSLVGGIPSKFNRLSALLSLNLKGNTLTGGIPAELSDIENLTSLDLANNQLTGTIPFSLSTLRSLRELKLGRNGLMGSIPPELGQLDELVSLELDNNQLTGRIPPQLGQLSKLQQLRLQANSISGSIPKELGHLRNLVTLYAFHNSLSGNLPPEFGNLLSLQQLAIYQNMLSGSIPAQLWGLPKLWAVYLSGNQLSGHLPPEVGNLTGARAVWLSRNRLTGKIPAEIGRLTELTELDLASNALSGPIPPEVGSLLSLKGLSLQANQLTGPIPSQVGNLRNLSILRLEKNMLSGTLPADLSHLSALKQLILERNLFVGSVPESFGNMSALAYLALGWNRLSGAVPEDLERLSNLRYLSLEHNQLSGTLPSGLGQLLSLERLSVEGNQGLGGFLPNTSLAASLQEIYAKNCSFHDAGPVGPRVKVLDFGANRFEQLPAAWRTQPSVEELRLNENQLNAWPQAGVVPRSAFFSETPAVVRVCGVGVEEEPFNWPKLTILHVSNNPQLGSGTNVRDFMTSLKAVPLLLKLHASGCGLSGDVPSLSEYYSSSGVPDGNQCASAPEESMKILSELYLSRNNISGVLGKPPASLRIADFSFNKLGATSEGVGLEPDWWHESDGVNSEGRPQALAQLSVKGNALLRYAVNPPLTLYCEDLPRPHKLTANARTFSAADNNATFECSGICDQAHMRYDVTGLLLDEAAMCRCMPGYAGSRTNCSSCSIDTFSQSLDTFGMARSCQACPVLSSTLGEENCRSICSCKCLIGAYMTMADHCHDSALRSSRGERCELCPLFKTTSHAGATQASQCICDVLNVPNLISVLGECACPSSYFMNYALKACQPCAGVGENCQWSNNVTRSILPPDLVPGFWAYPKSRILRAGSADAFTGNDIVRCFSAEACVDVLGTCAPGRVGKACSLCEPGKYGGPEGSCSTCPTPPDQFAIMLASSMLLFLPATLLLHLLLGRSSAMRGRVRVLRSLGVPLQQLLMFVQTLGVMSFFQVEWPQEMKDLFAYCSWLDLRVFDGVGLACVTGQQTATVEQLLRWGLPLAAALLAAVVPLLLWIVGSIMRCVGCIGERSLPSWLILTQMDSLRVMHCTVVLFFMTFVKNGLDFFVCTPSPNGEMTVRRYPHLNCPGGIGPASAEWLLLLIPGVTYLLILLASTFGLSYFAIGRILESLLQSEWQERGTWAYISDPFRDSCIDWPMKAMVKGLLISLTPVVFGMNGEIQLLLTTIVSAFYACRCLWVQPYKLYVHMLMEVWTNLTVAAICFYTAGMGFYSTPDTQSSQCRLGPNNESFQIRTQILFLLTLAGAFGSGGIVLYKVLGMFSGTRRWLPISLRPWDSEWQEDVVRKLIYSLNLQGTNMEQLMGRLDGTDLARLEFLLRGSSASVGILRSSEISATGVRQRMSIITRTISSRLSKGSMGSLSSSEPLATGEASALEGDVLDDADVEVAQQVVAGDGASALKGDVLGAADAEIAQWVAARDSDVLQAHL